MITYTNIFRRAYNLINQRGSGEFFVCRDKKGRFTTPSKATKFDPVTALKTVCREYNLNKKTETELVMKLISTPSFRNWQYNNPDDPFLDLIYE